MDNNYFTYNSADDVSHEQQANVLANNPEALVTVIVPIYNCESTLDKALRSIENQTHENLEIICLNDGSTDGSKAIIDEHAKHDARIVVVDKPNEGYGATCNRGIDMAHGEWIAIVEPDDWLELGMYEDMLQFAAQFYDKVDIIKTPYWRVEDWNTKHPRKLHCSYDKEMGGNWGPFSIEEAPALLRHHPSIWSALYRRDFLNKKGIRFKPIPGAGWSDNPFLIDTLCQSDKIVYWNMPYYCYCTDTDEKLESFHTNNPDIPFDRWDEMMDSLERLGIADEEILKVHYERGFMYLGGVLEYHSADEPEIRERMKAMFVRMSPSLVFEDQAIAPAAKRLFAEIMGIEDANISGSGHAAYLAGQAIYNMRNVGAKEMLNSVGRYISRYKKRSGGR